MCIRDSINTTDGRQAIADSFLIRREALNQKVAYATTMAAGAAIAEALQVNAMKNIFSLKELHTTTGREEMA